MLGDKTTGKQPGSTQSGEPGPGPAEAAQPEGQASGEPVFDSAQLFGNHKQISIEHNGGRYVLRITRLGKLVLNK